MMLQRFTLLLLAVCLSFNAMAQEETGLAQWVKQNPDWKQEKTGLAYVASHCATIFELVGNHMAVNPIHEEQRRSANTFLARSDTFARIGYFLSIKQGASQQQTVEQQQLFKTQFNAQMQENLSKHKNLMMPPLSLDVEVCMMNVKFFQVKVKELEIEFAKTTQPVKAYEPVAPDTFDMAMLDVIWAFIKTQTHAPEDAAMPRLVIQPDLPTSARMVFEFPSEEQPNNNLQINVSPRTLQAWSRSMVNWAFGHELTHYAMLMQENQWTTKTIYSNAVRHHCNPEFLRITSEIADLISDNVPSDKERLRMYSEVFRSCTRHPDQ
jgi:hypothetical protein